MFWHTHLQAPARRASGALLALGIALLILLGAGPAPATAGTDRFCSQSIPAGSICTGPTRSLTGVRGTNYGSGAGCGGAYAYGQYACATPAGCQIFSGANQRTPAIRHRSTTAKSMEGYSTWGSTAQPSYCDQGVPYAVSGPVTSAEPLDVPVLQKRAPQAAPKILAQLWPGADPTRARRFSSPAGEGWVMALPVDKKVCFAVASRVDTWSYACMSNNEARLRGSIMTVEDADPATAKGDVAIAFAPTGSKGLTVSRRDGSAKVVAPVDGVVAVTLAAGDTAVELAPAAGEATATAERWAVGRRRG